MSDAEHLIENAIMAMEKYPYDEAERIFLQSPINIMMAEDSGCPLSAVLEMAVYCTTTLRQDWKEKWEDEAKRWIPVTERPPKSHIDVWVATPKCGGGWRVNIGWYSDVTESWYVGESDTQEQVTHWKPLPDAPEEDDNA